MADIIDFNDHRKHRGEPTPQQEPDFPQALLEHLDSLPDNALMGSLSHVLNDKMVRLLMLTEMGAKASEVIQTIGLSPDDFSVAPESVDRYLAADFTDVPGPLWNGPWFDREDDDRLIRVATTVTPDGVEDLPGGYLIDVLRLDHGADHWIRLGEQGWIDNGPPADYFDLIDLDDDEDWDEDGDWDDGNPIRYLDLTPSVQETLLRAGIETIGQLAERTDEELLALKGIGKKALERIRAELEDWYG